MKATALPTKAELRQLRAEHPPLLLSTRQVAAQLDISYRRAELLMRSGTLPVVMIGKRRRVPLAALEQWALFPR